MIKIKGNREVSEGWEDLERVLDSQEEEEDEDEEEVEAIEEEYYEEEKLCHLNILCRKWELNQGRILNEFILARLNER